MRWFAEAWRAAQAARAEGADVVAVTAWSLLGAFDWDSLVTLDRGRYESGVFDLRSSPPRPTILAKVLREVSTTGRYPNSPSSTALAGGAGIQSASRTQTSDGSDGNAAQRPRVARGAC